MNEDQFRKLLEANNTALFERIDERLDQRFEQNNARLDKRLDEKFEQNNAVLFGQFTKYFDQRFNTLRDEFKGDTNRIYNAVDGLTKRIETDDQERLALTQEQKRHGNWIGQLAKSTNTRLVPEQ